MKCVCACTRRIDPCIFRVVHSDAWSIRGGPRLARMFYRRDRNEVSSAFMYLMNRSTEERMQSALLGCFSAKTVLMKSQRPQELILPQPQKSQRVHRCQSVFDTPTR
jgi:hypothetical protein